MPARLYVTDRIHVPANAIEVFAVRSSGPGGQNVNKVSSKIDLRVDLRAVVGLDLGALSRLLVLAQGHLDADGRLQVTSQRTRDQTRNLADAYEKVRALVIQALVRPVLRRPTRPSRGMIEARLRDKRFIKEKKTNRTPPPGG